MVHVLPSMGLRCGQPVVLGPWQYQLATTEPSTRWMTPGPVAHWQRPSR